MCSLSRVMSAGDSKVRPPLVGHVDEPVAHDGVGVDFAAICRAAAGAAQGVLVWAISSCVSGRAMVSPGRHQPGRCKRTPRGSSWWWRVCSWRARSWSCCLLGRPADRWRLTGGQLRPTDTAMAARSARTSSSEEDAEEDARSTNEQDRLLTERCIERQWKNTCLRLKRLPYDHESDGQPSTSERISKVS